MTTNTRTAVVTAKVEPGLLKRIDALTDPEVGVKRTHVVERMLVAGVEGHEALGRSGSDVLTYASALQRIAHLEAECKRLNERLVSGPRARATDPEAAQQAAERPAPIPKAGTQAGEVLKLYGAFRIQGLTPYEAFEALENKLGRRLARNGVDKRTSDLRRGGYITAAPLEAVEAASAKATAQDATRVTAQPDGTYTRVSGYGRPSTVYWLTVSGERALRAILDAEAKITATQAAA